MKNGWADGAGAFKVANSGTLNEFQAHDARAVIDRLNNMYYEGESRSLVFFEDAMDGIIKLYRRLTIM